MHVAGDVRHVEAPPLKRAAIQVEMQIGVVLAVHGDGALDVGNRRLLELVRFDRAGDVRADGARDDHRLGGAEAVGQIDLLRREVRPHAVRAESAASPRWRRGELNCRNVVGVLEGGLEAAGGLAAKGEIGQRHPGP